VTHTYRREAENARATAREASADRLSSSGVLRQWPRPNQNRTVAGDDWLNSHNEDVRLLFCFALLPSLFSLTAQTQFRPIESRWVTIRQPSKLQSPHSG
jgi:hypothetical protein